MLSVSSTGSVRVELLSSTELPAEGGFDPRSRILLKEDDSVIIQGQKNAFLYNLAASMSRDRLYIVSHFVDTSFKDLSYYLPIRVPTIYDIIITLIQGPIIEIIQDSLMLIDLLPDTSHILATVFKDSARHVNTYLRSVDEFGLKAIFLHHFRFKLRNRQELIEFERIFLSFEILCAHKSDSQVQLIESCTLLAGGALNFEEFSFFKIWIWLRNIDDYRSQLESVARNEFNRGKNLDLSTTLYILLGKARIASVLWKKSIEPESGRLQEFLASSFEKPENRLKAEKNAFSLIGKQRFILALGFFCLAKKSQDALQICGRLSTEFPVIFSRLGTLLPSRTCPHFLGAETLQFSLEQLHVAITGSLIQLTPIRESAGLTTLFDLLRRVPDVPDSLYIKFLLERNLLLLALSVRSDLKFVQVSIFNLIEGILEKVQIMQRGEANP